MDFSHFVTMHHAVSNMSHNRIKCIVSSLDKQSMQQLLLIYCQFFFNPKNRNKYVINNNSPSHYCHLKIIDKIQEKTKPNPTANKFNPFNTLPSLLTAHIVSYLNNKSRLRTSLTNLSFFKASYHSISKSHLTINKSFIANKLCQKENIFNTNHFKNISSFTVMSNTCTQRGG
eukprot:UN03244